MNARHIVSGRLSVVSRSGREGIVAVCTCRWQGPARYGAMATRRAQDDARDHLDAVEEV